MARVKTSELHALSKGNLAKKIEELRDELSKLRIAQITQGGSGKSGAVKAVRKDIARALTIATLKKRTTLKALYKGKKHRPLDLRVKRTRALRRALSKHEASIKTIRQQKREKHFPLNKKIYLKA